MSAPFLPASGKTVNIDVGAASARVALAGAGIRSQIRVYNGGTASVWIEFGDVTVAAGVATSIPIPAGAIEILTLPELGMAAPYVAAIAAAATGKVYFTPGLGV